MTWDSKRGLRNDADAGDRVGVDVLCHLVRGDSGPLYLLSGMDNGCKFPGLFPSSLLPTVSSLGRDAEPALRRVEFTLSSFDNCCLSNCSAELCADLQVSCFSL
jgi:hypothetical protein